MNNQEPQNPNPSTEHAAVEKRRRFIKGVAVAAPVVLTLSSPSVFGNGVSLCLSQQMSGNTSGTPTGNCVPGNNATYWLNTPAAWPSGYSYGIKGTGTKTPVCLNYSSGTTFLAAFGSGSGTGMQQLLCSSLTSNYSTFITALLNSVAVPNYILTKEQVIAMWAAGVLTGGPLPPPGYPNTLVGKVAFLKTTWSGT